MVITNLVESQYAHILYDNAVAAGKTALATALKTEMDAFVLNSTAEYNVQTPEDLNVTDDFVNILGDTVAFVPTEA